MTRTRKELIKEKEVLKLFTAQTGKFQMFIPIEWEHKNPSFYKNDPKAPESFGQYEKMRGAFQVSCVPISESNKHLIEDFKLKTQSSDSETVHFTEKQIVDKSTHYFTWICAIDDHIILATYIVDANKLKPKKGLLELEQVKNSLDKIKFIKPEYRDIVIAQNRYGLFMSSIAATVDLKNRALSNGAFIELIALTANHIDALLRIAIILKNQLEEKNDDIDISILYQREGDIPIMEKKIYSRAMEMVIIDKTLFDELNSLYNERNKVIHRYIITDLRTEEIMQIAFRYDQLENKVSELVDNLENNQVELKVGLFGRNLESENEPKQDFLKRLQYQIRDKHGKVKLPTMRT